MRLIENLHQLIENIETVELYLTEGTEQQKSEIIKLIKRGTCFVAYNAETELRFAPSRFLGYSENTIEEHLQSDDKDGRETNDAINDILQAKPLPNNELENQYRIYCNSLGIHPNEKGAFGVQRKFWTLSLKQDFQRNIDLTGDFPEGKIVERTHKARERNSKVITLAKENFKRKYGKLFCQACGFDFEKVYGEIGQDFIEGHHTIAVKEMPPDYRTKPEEIAMLCSNCHRMVHKKRPWLSMDKLTTLLTDKSMAAGNN
jgi:5-methylcytosine-specific restriction protein A